MRAEGEFTKAQIVVLRDRLWKARARVDGARRAKDREPALEAVRLASERVRLAEAHAAPESRSNSAEEVARSLGADAKRLVCQLAKTKEKPTRRGPALRALQQKGLLKDLDDLSKVALTKLGREVVEALDSAGSSASGARGGRILDDPEPIEGISIGKPE